VGLGSVGRRLLPVGGGQHRLRSAVLTALSCRLTTIAERNGEPQAGY
jgi:hypothetical protein